MKKLIVAFLIAASLTAFGQVTVRQNAATVTSITGSTPVVVTPSGSVFAIGLQPCAVGQVLQWQATPAPAGYKCATITTVQNDFWRSSAGATLPDGTTDTTESIRRNGNTGINIAPLAPLHVASTAIGPAIVANFENTDTGSGTSEPRVVFSEGGNWWQGIGAKYNGGAPILSFSVNNAANTWKDQLQLYSTGMSGVGLTQAPAAKWVIQNTANATGALKLTSTTTAAGDSWWLGFGHGANSADANDRARIGVNMSAAGAGRLTFSTGVAGSQTERVRIDEVGRLSVGLGATAAVDLLSLQGGALSFNNPANPVPYVGVDFDQTTDGLRFRTNQGTAALNTTNMFLSRASGNFGVGNGASTNPNSQLQVAGSFSVPLNVATTSLTLTAAMHTVSVNNAAANVTITLPTPAGVGGRIYVIKRDTGSIGAVTVATAAGTVQALSGTFGATTTLSAAGLYGQHVHFQSDGVKWHRIN